MDPSYLGSLFTVPRSRSRTGPFYGFSSVLVLEPPRTLPLPCHSNFRLQWTVLSPTVRTDHGGFPVSTVSPRRLASGPQHLEVTEPHRPEERGEGLLGRSLSGRPPWKGSPVLSLLPGCSVYLRLRTSVLMGNPTIFGGGPVTRHTDREVVVLMTPNGPPAEDPDPRAPGRGRR